MLLLSFVGVIYTAVVDNGRPWCDTEDEISISFFRNNFDATAYWVCYELDTPATLQRCPDQTAFLDSVKSCVSWDEWEWESPEENRRRK